jgi:putative transposase
MKNVYRQLKDACTKDGTRPPSYKTFTKRVQKRRIYEQTRKRAGRKAAEQVRTWFWYLGLDVPPHGDFALHIVHEDHTQLDIELRCSRTGRNLGRPWLSLLICAHTRRVLAVYISFEPPSYRSSMMLLRECYRRFGRLPETLVADAGSDFGSTYFEAMLAFFGITKKDRPVSQPRDGSVIEALFGINNMQFVHELVGNTQASREPRQMTPATNPKTLAVWPLGPFTVRARQYLYEIYDTRDHGTLGQSPREAFQMSVLMSGERAHMAIWSLEDFYRETMPTTDRGTARVQVSRGIKVGHFWYNHPRLDASDVIGTSVEVRYDPFDLGVVLAYVQGEWVECRPSSRIDSYLQGRTERELEALNEEFRARRRKAGQNTDVNDAKLVEFMNDVREEETILTERLRALANADARKVMQGEELDHEAYIMGDGDVLFEDDADSDASENDVVIDDGAAHEDDIDDENDAGDEDDVSDEDDAGDGNDNNNPYQNDHRYGTMRL